MHKDMNSIIITSTNHNPWYNLALEEFLFNKVTQHEVILYLWQNDNTVVIGKNQNPWKECKCNELEKNGGKLARRSSGGGAVYHDLGNLNFTFIMHRDYYDLEKQLNVILNSVKKLGVNPQFTGRNDLTIDNKKFSGNAFYFDDYKALHHGTLLINSDMEKLTKYLKVSKEKISSKGIDSIKSRVINLSDVNSSIKLENLSKSLRETFTEMYENKSYSIDSTKFNDEFKDLLEKYSSWEWRYGETPDFEIEFSERFIWGGINIGLNLENGYIKDLKIYSDALDCNLIKDISDKLKGVKFEEKTIYYSLENIKTSNEGQKILRDFSDWFLLKLR